jgi:hypothetical protein
MCSALDTEAEDEDEADDEKSEFEGDTVSGVRYISSLVWGSLAGVSRLRSDMVESVENGSIGVTGILVNSILLSVGVKLFIIALRVCFYELLLSIFNHCFLMGNTTYSNLYYVNVETTYV